MRNLIYAINLTIDGCCDHTKMTAGDDVLEFFSDLIRGADLLVYGRVTYQLMVPYWPDIAKNKSGDPDETEFAQVFDSADKLVFSHSLEKIEDKRSRLARNTLQDEILRLKREQGKYILLGGVDLPSQLIALGLVDEFIIVVQPVIAGEGRRLLEGGSLQEKLPLKLVKSKTLKSGCVALHYVKL
ncbi:MAG TPA: dihydrofolate reductase family protein [Chitinophagaceae bacterium]|jgi:dihydrofolate reductase